MFSTVKGVRPVFLQNDELYLAKGFNIAKAIVAHPADYKVVSKYGGLKETLIATSPLATRILREGIHFFLPMQNGSLLMVRNKLLFAKNGGGYKVVLDTFNGSRPLNICKASNGNLYFGEYFSNGERGEVKIFTSTDGEHWDVAYTFKPGSIRHVHGIYEDSYRNGFWVLTGDSDDESALWFTNDGFKTLTPLGRGSQKARAVGIIPTEKGIITPMDSPFQVNYIQLFNPETEQFQNLLEIGGSAFHAQKYGDIHLVTTVTEPSPVNKTNAAYVYGSLDGDNWKLIEAFRRDIFPVKYQNYTRYSEIELLPFDHSTSKYIFAYARAVAKYDNCMLCFDKELLRAQIASQ